MPRSISFVIEGMVPTQVCVTGNLDGTLSFEFTRLDTGSVGDLEAVFLDLNSPFAGEGFKIFGDVGLTVGACAKQGVDTLGRAAKITRAVIDDLGDFDIGIAFGALDADRGASRRTGFTLAHDAAPLTLDMIDLADFGLRYGRCGAGRVDVPASKESGRRPQGAARQDALEVIEIPSVRARPLANDRNGGVLAVIDLQAACETVAAFVGKLDRAPEDRGGEFDVLFAAAALLGHEAENGHGSGGVDPRFCPWPMSSWDGLHPQM